MSITLVNRAWVKAAQATQAELKPSLVKMFQKAFNLDYAAAEKLLDDTCKWMTRHIPENPYLGMSPEEIQKKVKKAEKNRKGRQR